jgi:hypothetical protein
MQKFLVWGFGDDLEKIRNCSDLVSAWNIRHDDLYKINPKYRSIEEDVEEMIDIWKAFG